MSNATRSSAGTTPAVSGAAGSSAAYVGTGLRQL